MFDKLLQAQQMAEDIKKRLDNISVSAEVESGKIVMHATANKKITGLTIDPEYLKSADAEQLEELLIILINKTLGQADSVSQSEMQAATRDMMGGLGDMFGK